MKNKYISIIGGITLLLASCAQSFNLSEPDYDNNVNTVSRAASSSSKAYRNVIYTYGLSDVSHPEYYSHICIAFLKVKSDCSLESSSSAFKASTIKDFKNKNPNVKVLASLSGGSDSATEALRSALKKDMDKVVSNLTQFVKDRNLDGIDLDWEYFDNYSECNPLYLKFAKKLRSAMPNKCITIAAQTGESFYGNSDVKKMLSEYLDFVNVMTYDFDYSARSKKQIGFNGNFERTKEIVQAYSDIVGKQNVNIGLPYYGIVATVKSRSAINKGDSTTSAFETIDFKKIVDGGSAGSLSVSGIGLTNAENPTTYHDNNGVAVYNNGSYVFVYDNSKTIRNKVEWALNYGVGGVMAWQASCDYKSTLQGVAYNAIKKFGKIGNPTTNNSSGSVSGFVNRFDSKDSLPKVISSLDTSAKTGAFVLNSKYFKSYGFTTTNGGSLKLTPAQGRYTIDLYIRTNNIPSGSSVFFDTRSSNSSTIEKISVLEELDNSGNVVKNLIPVDRTGYEVKNTGFTNIVSRTLTGTTGWIHIQYYGHNTTGSESIYMDNLIISN